jgi:hypothetical protein
MRETIDKVRPGDNNELKKQDTISELPAPDRKRELFDQLRDLLNLVDKAFIDPDHPQFPNELCDKLLITIEALQPYLGKVNSYRAPFWKCVKAVNNERPSLRLISRLDKLVARASGLPLSPLEKLEILQEENQLNLQEAGFVEEIKKAINTYSNEPVLPDPMRWAPFLKPYSEDPVPSDVVRWASVLKRVNSRQYETQVKTLGQNAPHIMRYSEVTDFVAFARWLDFTYQYLKWRERIWPALSSFLTVLVQLENEIYFRQVFSGPVPKAVSMKSEMARFRSRLRQRKHRRALKTQSPKISRPKSVTKRLTGHPPAAPIS